MSKRELSWRSFAENLRIGTPANAWSKSASVTGRIDLTTGSANTRPMPNQAGVAVFDQANVASPPSTATSQGEYFPGHTGGPDDVIRGWAWSGTQTRPTLAAVAIATVGSAAWHVTSILPVAA